MLEFRNVTKYFGKKPALDNVSFSIDGGIATAILGPNGSGKTTIINMSLGLLKPDKGEIFLNGVPVWENREEIVSKIGVVSETPDFYPNLTAEENLKLFAMLRKVPEQNIQPLLQTVGLDKAGNTIFARFSLGMKQRLNVAYSLLSDPQFFIFDEPTNGLDPVGISAIRDMMLAISSRKKTIIMCSHLLDEVEKICQKAIIIKNGKILDKVDVSSLYDETVKYQIGYRDISSLVKTIESINNIKIESVGESSIVIETIAKNTGSVINEKLAKKNIFVSELTRLNSLEKKILEKISGENQ